MTTSPSLSRVEWLRFGPFLAHLIVTRRCNLRCGYCTEYDRGSDPVPLEVLRERLERLRALRTYAVSLLGGEPTLHPDLLALFHDMRRLGFHRRMMITNGIRLTRALIEGMNDAGVTHINISVDGVRRTPVTVKVLDTLRRRLDLLAEHARFEVVVNAVLGAAPRDEVLAVVEFAEARGFTPRVLLLHDPSGQLMLTPEERALYVELKARLGRRAREAGDYRERLLRDGVAPFRCRAGARYVYVDEHGIVRWCAQTRDAFGKPLEDYTRDDLRGEFDRPKSCSDRCTVGCVRSVSALDAWRPQAA